MGQTLKENIKQLIVDSAINDLYENGVAGASMRKIATDANMTVGNLYRYFKNKDELINYIIEPVYDKISSVLLKHTNQSLNLDDHLDISGMTYEDMLKTFDDIVVELCNLYDQHRRIFTIVLKSQAINTRFLLWISDIIYCYLSFHMDERHTKKIKQLSRMYAMSLCSGIIDVFLNNDLNKDELEQVLRLYFKTTLTIINVNFKELEI